MFIDITKLPAKLNELNYFKKNIDKKGTTIYSYSLKNQITIVCELDELEIENDFCIDSKTIDMIRLLSPIKEIVIDKDFTIKSKKGNYKTKLISSNLMLDFLNLKYEKTLNVNFEKLKNASQFVAKDNKRPILTGVNVTDLGDIIATNSFISFRYVNKEMIHIPRERSITIPSSFIDFIAKLSDSETITINFNRNNCMVQLDNVKYITNLLEGNYPSLDKIYATKIQYDEIVFDANDLKEKFFIAKEVGQDKNNEIIFFSLENDKLVSKGVNDFEAILKPLKNEVDYKFTVSLEYLNIIINNLKENTINVLYKQSDKPIFFLDNDNEFLILPMRRD